MHPANVDIDGAVEGIVGKDGDDAEMVEPGTDGLDQFRCRAQQHDVVNEFHGRGGDIVDIDHFHAQIICFCPQSVSQIVGDIAQQQAGGMRGRFKTGAERVIVVGIGMCADDPGRSARLEAGAIFELISGSDTGPRFGQGAFGITGGWLHGDEIVAVIAIEDALVDHVVLRQTALDFVAIGVAYAIDEDVSLDGESVSDIVLVPQVFADSDHRHSDLVAEHDRVVLHAAVNAGMLFTQADDFDVGEAEAGGVVAHQQFVRAVLGDGYLAEFTILAQIIQSGAVKMPFLLSFWQWRYRRF